MGSASPSWPSARYLEEQRKERGLSREEFSGRSGLSVATIRRIEKGETAALDSVRKICLGLDVSLSVLFMKFEDQDAATLREISWLLHGRDPRLIALAAEMVRTLVQGADAFTSAETPPR